MPIGTSHGVQYDSPSEMTSDGWSIMKDEPYDAEKGYDGSFLLGQAQKINPNDMDALVGGATGDDGSGLQPPVSKDLHMDPYKEDGRSLTGIQNLPYQGQPKGDNIGSPYPDTDYYNKIAYKQPATEPQNNGGEASNPSTPFSSPDSTSSERAVNSNTQGKSLSQRAFEAILGPDRVKTWPEKMVTSIISAAALPGDVASGKVDPNSQEAIDRATDLAMNMVFSPTALVNKATDGTLGSIVGVGAKSANKDSLEVAKDLAGRKFDKDLIYKETGWYEGRDGKWKSELDSSKATLKDPADFARDPTVPKQVGIANLEEVLDFPKLYEAYPELKTLQVVNHSFEKLGATARAYFNRGGHGGVDGLTKNGIVSIEDKIPYIGIDMDRAKLLATGADKTDLIHGDISNSPLNIILHEVQHWIQQKEGFYNGTNPTAAKEFFENNKANVVMNATEEELKPLEVIAKHAGMKNFDSWLGPYLYRADPGEREAILVQARQAMSYAQRKASSPENMNAYLEKTHEYKFPPQIKMQKIMDDMATSEMSTLKGPNPKNPDWGGARNFKWTENETSSLRQWLKDGNKASEFPTDKFSVKDIYDKMRREDIGSIANAEKIENNQKIGKQVIDMWKTGAGTNEIAVAFKTTRGRIAGIINRSGETRTKGRIPNTIRQSKEAENIIHTPRNTPSLPRLKFMDEPFE